MFPSLSSVKLGIFIGAIKSEWNYESLEECKSKPQ